MRTLVVGLGATGSGFVHAARKQTRAKVIGMPVLFDLPAL
jgi:hypothetical protein